VGLVTATSTEAELKKAYELLRDADLASGTGLIPHGDPGSMLDVTWCKGGKGVCEVRAAYGLFKWKTRDGIARNMTLAEHEKLNGGPVMIDSGGEVNAGGGKLAELGKTLFLTFKPSGASGLHEDILKRYLMGPAWKSNDREMGPLAARMRLVELRVLLRKPAN
jgi:hypothetical protein